ncbi:MAG: hypothetical protein HY319_04470 [Armatimonadetes bacterium]|nr:hypothetical protein [Armatimonadota bacterium]
MGRKTRSVAPLHRLDAESRAALKAEESGVLRWGLLVLSEGRIRELQLWDGPCRSMLNYEDGPTGELLGLSWDDKAMSLRLKNGWARWDLTSGEWKPVEGRNRGTPVWVGPGCPQFRRSGDRLVVVMDGSERVERPIVFFKAERERLMSLPATRRLWADVSPRLESVAPGVLIFLKILFYGVIVAGPMGGAAYFLHLLLARSAETLH